MGQGRQVLRPCCQLDRLYDPRSDVTHPGHPPNHSTSSPQSEMEDGTLISINVRSGLSSSTKVRAPVAPPPHPIVSVDRQIVTTKDHCQFSLPGHVPDTAEDVARGVSPGRINGSSPSHASQLQCSSSVVLLVNQADFFSFPHSLFLSSHECPIHCAASIRC